MAKQEPKYLPAENGETENKEVSPSPDEAGIKKTSLINFIYQVLSVVPVSLLIHSRGIFLLTILMKVF